MPPSVSSSPTGAAPSSSSCPTTPPHIPNQVPLTYEQEYTEKGLRRNYAVRRGPWKLVGGKELFDLSRDPYERKNLAERQPGRVNELQEAFDRWSYFC